MVVAGWGRGTAQGVTAQLKFSRINWPDCSQTHGPRQDTGTGRGCRTPGREWRVGYDEHRDQPLVLGTHLGPEGPGKTGATLSISDYHLSPGTTWLNIQY